MSGEGPRPVAPTDRVSDVLARDEALVEVFVRQAPQFTKLRNRSMRRIMARLVTVEQAARMAAVEPAALVGELNAALGIATESAAAPSGPTADPAVAPEREPPPGAPVVEVDVREELRAGREPFSKIMAAVAGLGEGEILLLRATFEPIPLYAVLGKRGLVHRARAAAPGDWSVWFWRPSGPAHPPPPTAPADVRAAPAATGTPAVPAAAPLVRGTEPNTVWLDVRGLEPPEPMVRTLAALEALPRDHTLVQVNVRVPQFLLPVLAERGFTWKVDETAADAVVVRIRRAG